MNLSPFAVKVRVMNSCRIITLLAISLVGCRQATPPTPAGKVLHVCNWHFVPKEHFVADLRSANDVRFTEQELAAQYAVFLDEVEAVQREQVEELRKLIREHGLKHVWLEGLTESRMLNFEELINKMKSVEAKSIPRIQGELNKVTELIASLDTGSPDLAEAKKAEAKLVALLQLQRERRLRIGAAGLLYMNGELEHVMPLDDDVTFAKANPVTPGGTVVFDVSANEDREDAVARRLRDAKEQVAVIVLGGGHQLSDNFRRSSRANVQYERIELPAWKTLMEQYGR